VSTLTVPLSMLHSWSHRLEALFTLQAAPPQQASAAKPKT
jgi:hypothetical protein